MNKFTLLLIGLFAINNAVNAQWTAVNNGLPNSGTNTDVESFAYISANLFAATSSGVYMTGNNGGIWTGVNSGITNTDIEALAAVGPYLFAGTGHGIFMSSTSGTSWNAVNTGLDTSMGTSVYALFADGTNLFAGTEAGVFLTSTYGTSWTGVNTGLPKLDFYAFAKCGSYIYSGGFGVYQKPTSGASWSELTSGLPPLLDSDFESFAVSGTNVFAGDLGGGVYWSNTDGASWSAVNTNLTNLHVHALAVSGSKLFAGTDGGVFLSTNLGADWTAVNTGLTDLNVQSLEVFGSNLFAGTGNGVFVAPLSSLAGINETENEDMHISIFSNPCNGTFQISNDASEVMQVELFDVTGESVLQKELCSGTNQMDISNLPNGIYIVKFTAFKGSFEKKLIKE